jgi:microcystin-dependent protein
MIKDIILYIVIALLVASNIYLIYKTRHVEHFTVSDDIKQAINDIYKADINAIRNLSNFSTEIMNNNDSLTIPAKTTTTIDLVTTGNLTVNGNINFTNKNNNMIEIFPQYMVIAWASSNIPKGWAICDGKKYKLNTDGTSSEDINGIPTPDLRGRFVLGAGIPNGNTTLKDTSGRTLTSRNINDIGGEESHELSLPELPAHNHKMNWQYIGCRGENCYGPASWVTIGTATGNKMSWSDYTNPVNWPQTTDDKGGNTPHNNMPPFYVLTYIMKL